MFHDHTATGKLKALITTAAGLIVEEPNYSRLASRLLATVIDKEVRNQNIPWFSESIKVGYNLRQAVEGYNRATSSLESRVMVTARRFRDYDAGLDVEKLAELETVELTPRLLQDENAAPPASPSST